MLDRLHKSYKFGKLHGLFPEPLIERRRPMNGIFDKATAPFVVDSGFKPVQHNTHNEIASYLSLSEDRG